MFRRQAGGLGDADDHDGHARCRGRTHAAAGQVIAKPALWYQSWLGDWRNQRSNRPLPVGQVVRIAIELDLTAGTYRIAVDGGEAERGKLDNAKDFGGLTLAFLGESSDRPRAFGLGPIVLSRRYTGPPVTVQAVTTPDPVNLLLASAWKGKAVPVRVAVLNRTDKPVKAMVGVQPADESGPHGTAITQAVSLEPLAAAEIELAVPLPGPGWWGIDATASVAATAHTRPAALCLLPDPVEGLRPASMFGMGFRAATNDTDLHIARRLGIKWRRGADKELAYPGRVAPKPGEWWDEAARERLRDDVDRWSEAGVSTLGYISYNIPWNIPPGTQVHRTPPADMTLHAEMVGQLVEALRGRVHHWELWNEPGGHFWGGTSAQYRQMLKAVWDRVKPVAPEVKLIAGGHYMWISRNWILPPGEVADAGWCDGLALHPYAKPGLWTPVSPALDAALLTKAKGSGGGLWMTEVGTPPGWHWKGRPVAQALHHIARAIAPVHLLSKAGARDTDLKVFWFMNAYGRPGPLRPKQTDPDSFNMWDHDVPLPALAAYAAMTSALEDGVFVGDVYAGSLRAWALLFAKPDGSHTVALWPESTWPAEDMLAADDRRSTWDLPALDFTVTDWLGRPAGTRTDGRLRFTTVARGTHYLHSTASAEAIRAALGAAQVQGLPLLRVVPQPIAEPLASGAQLRIRMRNDAFAPRDVILRLKADGLDLGASEVRVVSLPPGEDRYVDVAITAARPQPDNRYRVTWEAEAGDERLSGAHEVQVAVAASATPTIDGDLSDWTEATFVSIRNRGPLSDWWDIRPSMLYDRGYRLAMRWDDDFLYVAAEIPDRSSKLDDSGQDSGSLEYRNRGNDRLHLGFNLLDHNPDDPLRDHPLYAKSLASDIDYEFSAELRAGNDGAPAKAVLRRLLAPGTHYHTTSIPGLEPARGPLDASPEGGRDGRIAVVYDPVRRHYRYELALAWHLLPPLRDRLRALAPGKTAQAPFCFITPTPSRCVTTTVGADSVRARSREAPSSSPNDGA